MIRLSTMHTKPSFSQGKSHGEAHEIVKHQPLKAVSQLLHFFHQCSQI